MIRALTLHQPYATLIATGAKRVETRSWAAPPWLTGERIAIHAGKGTDYLELADEDPFSTALLTAGIGLDIRSAVPLGLQLPRGAVLCTAVLDRCNPITEEGANVLADTNPCEYAFGNYSLADGPRWAWVLRDVEVSTEPIYCRGYQKLWPWHDEPQGRLVSSSRAAVARIADRRERR